MGTIPKNFAVRTLVKISSNENLTLLTVMQKLLEFSGDLYMLKQVSWPIPIIFRRALAAERARPRKWKGPIPAGWKVQHNRVPEPAEAPSWLASSSSKAAPACKVS